VIRNGKVSFFDSSKGFGFIIDAENNEKYFVHVSGLIDEILKITQKQFINTVKAGFLFLTFGNGVVVWALQFVDSGFAALEVSAQPLVVC